MVLANAVWPGDNAADAAAIPVGVFTHGLDAARWQLIWEELQARGFDSFTRRLHCTDSSHALKHVRQHICARC